MEIPGRDSENRSCETRPLIINLVEFPRHDPERWDIGVPSAAFNLDAISLHSGPAKTMLLSTFFPELQTALLRNSR